MSEIDLNLVPPAPAKGGVPFLFIVCLFLIGIAIGYFLAKYSFRKVVEKVVEDKAKMEKNVRFAEPVERAVYRNIPARFPEPVTVRMSDLMYRPNPTFGGPSKVEEVQEKEPEPVSEIQPVEPEPQPVEQKTLEGESERVPEKEPERVPELEPERAHQGSPERIPVKEPEPEPEPKPTKPKTKRAPRKKPAPAPVPEPEAVSEEKPETVTTSTPERVSEEKPEMPASTEVIV